jgi:hypothetical protein
VAGLPGPAADAAEKSASAGVAVADRLDSPAFLDAVREAFVAGMDRTLLVSGALAVAGAVLALIFLPPVARAAVPARQNQEHDLVDRPA